MAANLKEKAHELVDHLPDNATWDDLMEEVRLQRAEEQATQLAEQLESLEAFDKFSQEANELIQNQNNIQ